MALPEIVSAEGVRLALRIDEGLATGLDVYAAMGALRLKAVIGATNYAAVLAQTATTDEQLAAIRAGCLYGAAAYYEEGVQPASAKGALQSTKRGELDSATYAYPDDVAKGARLMRNQAESILRDAGLWQEVPLVVGTVIPVDEDEDS